MPRLLCFLSCIFLTFNSTLASPVAAIPPPPPHEPTSSKLPDNSVLFSPPSQNPIPNHHQPLSDGSLASHGTITSPSPDHLNPVKYTLSSQICYPLLSEATYLMSDLSHQLLLEHLDGVTFPTPASTSAQSSFPLPVFIAANITEQLYRTRYVLSLALKLTPMEESSDRLAPSHWRAIMETLGRSVDELDRTARMKKNGAGLGSLLVFETEMEGFGVWAEWRFWRMDDGMAVLCER